MDLVAVEPARAAGGMARDRGAGPGSTHVVTVQCDDRPGIVSAVSQCIASQGGNITEAQQFNDHATGRFFMRVEVDFRNARGSVDAFRRSFESVGAEFSMDWRIRDRSVHKRVLVLVSQHEHCLRDLLYRWRVGDLSMDLVGVASNHVRPAGLGMPDSVPFHHLPLTRETRPQQEAAIRRLVEESKADLVVLARYMQILSDDLARFLAGRCINIHHSFLPGFKGAKPYHQAYDRGVKMIGATAHFVTADLDEGPIIHQDVEHISHSDRPEALVRKGRDIERRVLAHAVRSFLEDRVFPNGGKTVVFAE
jgi:formyltetrahydrofolate deformylase